MVEPNLFKDCSSRIREDEEMSYSGQETDIKQLLNRLNPARMKSGTTRFLGAQKCKILGESFLTMYI